jgi:hypothetical protein
MHSYLDEAGATREWGDLCGTLYAETPERLDVLGKAYSIHIHTQSRQYNKSGGDTAIKTNENIHIETYKYFTLPENLTSKTEKRTAI